MTLGAWVREGVILFIAFLEALFAINRGRAVVIIKIGQPIDEDAPSTGGGELAIVLNNEQKVTSTVSARDADGQAVEVGDLAVEVLDAGTPPVFTVEVIDDTFIVHSVEPANPGDVTVGTGKIRVTAGGESLDVDVVVETSEVTAITVESGAPEPE